MAVRPRPRPRPRPGDRTRSPALGLTLIASTADRRRLPPSLPAAGRLGWTGRPRGVAGSVLSPWGGQRWEAQNGGTGRLRKTPAPVETRASAPPHDAGDVCSIQTSCFSEAYRQCQAALLALGFDLLMNALAESEPANISLPVFWEEVTLNCHWWRRRSRYSFFTRHQSQPTGHGRRHVLALSRCQPYSASHLSDVARHLAECHVSSGSRDCLPCPAGRLGSPALPSPALEAPHTTDHTPARRSYGCVSVVARCGDPPRLLPAPPLSRPRSPPRPAPLGGGSHRSPACIVCYVLCWRVDVRAYTVAPLRCG